MVWSKLQSNLECFWNEIENGFEIKEKKEKKIRKIKEFKKLFLENLPKIGSSMLELESVLKSYLCLIWFIFEMVLN